MCYQPIKIIDPKTKVPTFASCRRCIECMQVRANEWALRGHFELMEHENNCFLTLTYDQNPVILIKSDLQKFIKRLRKHIDPLKIKYFSTGEYGDKMLRPHFHLVVFGYDFPDKRYHKKSQSGMPIYISETLSKLWTHGHAVIQDANVNTIRYAAKYAAKQKNVLPDHLKEFPEFNTMSQNLGVDPILKRMETYLETDEIYVHGFAYKIPTIILEKYALRKYNGIYHKRDEFVKQIKEQRALSYNFRTAEQNILIKRLKEKKRMLTKQRYL